MWNTSTVHPLYVPCCLKSVSMAWKRICVVSSTRDSGMMLISVMSSRAWARASLRAEGREGGREGGSRGGREEGKEGVRKSDGEG